jgi:hypothetical protein
VQAPDRARILLRVEEGLAAQRHDSGEKGSEVLEVLRLSRGRTALKGWKVSKESQVSVSLRSGVWEEELCLVHNRLHELGSLGKVGLANNGTYRGLMKVGCRQEKNSCSVLPKNRSHLRLLEHASRRE